MMPVVAIRPQPGCNATVARLEGAGLDAKGFPMFTVRPLDWEAPDAESLDALLVGSANAIRHGGAALRAYTGKPTYAVGEKTAQAARDAGLEIAATGAGGLQDLLTSIKPGHRRLLRLAGAQRVELTPPEGIEMVERIVYSSDALPMPQELAEILVDPALVLLHSAQAARHFAQCCDERNIDRSRISLATIGPRVSDAAGTGWRALRAAANPSEDALLALAQEMCQEAPGPKENVGNARMQDQIRTTDLRTTPPQERSTRNVILIAVLAFLLGSAVVVWLEWRGHLDSMLPDQQARTVSETNRAGGTEGAQAQPETVQTKARSNLEKVSTVEARLAMLEDRFSRINLQANAASGNAARAENLLIAFATRRMTDRGQPLGYLADQLRLRFSNAQPRAVQTITDFAEHPVTLDELSARLDALAPQLAGGPDDESFWDSATRELANLFTIRREPSNRHSPEARLERARVMLTAGKIPEAISQVERLPGAETAQRWIADARRYAAVQDALDLIETAAMLEPSKLQDSEGNPIDQPSPIATPADDDPGAAKKAQ